MPRQSRVVAPNVPLHIIQRDNNRKRVFIATMIIKYTPLVNGICRINRNTHAP